ncbi:hypothetical protein [Sporosarcina sp. OR05]|uniref:hypothetical protein n=1 Tax=Sporosarcina sp. OR05 TaxID=2969819 RepID=UPI003529F3D8
MTKPLLVKSSMLVLGIIGVILITFFVKSESPLAVQSSQNELKQVYANEFSDKLQNTGFASEVLQAISEKGYDPTSSLGFLVDSPDKQIIAVYLKNINQIDEKVIKDIQDIVNIASKNNNFNPFTVDVQISGDN